MNPTTENILLKKTNWELKKKKKEMAKIICVDFVSDWKTKNGFSMKKK